MGLQLIVRGLCRSPSSAVSLIKTQTWYSASVGRALHAASPYTGAQGHRLVSAVSVLREGQDHIQNENCKPACKSSSVLQVVSFQAWTDAVSSDLELSGASTASGSLGSNIRWTVCIHFAQTLGFHWGLLGNWQLSHLDCSQALWLGQGCL